MSNGSASLYLRRLDHLLSSLLGHDHFSIFTTRRSWASAASSINVEGNHESHLPPLSRQHGSMAAAAEALPITVYHQLMPYGDRAASAWPSAEDYVYPHAHQLDQWRPRSWKPRELRNPSFNEISSVTDEPYTSLAVSSPSRTLPLTLDSGYKEYLHQLRKAKTHPSLEPSHEEYAKALQMEMGYHDTAEGVKDRCHDAIMKRGAIDEIKGGRNLIRRWQEEVTTFLTLDKDTVLKSLTSNSLVSSIDYTASYYAILNTLSPSQLAEIVIRSVCRRTISSSKDSGVKFTSLSSSVGDDVLRHLRYLELCDELSNEKETMKGKRKGVRLAKKECEASVQYEEAYSEQIKVAKEECDESKRSINCLKTLISQVNSNQQRSPRSLSAAVDRITGLEAWNVEESIRIGGELIHALVKSATVLSKPAFIHQVERESSASGISSSSLMGQGSAGPSRSHVVGVIKMEAVAMSLFSSIDFFQLVEQTLPMLIPPLPWQSPRSGGHLSVFRSIARVSDRQHIEAIWAAHKRGNLSKVYEALTTLGQVPWRVNTQVLDIMERLFASSSPSQAARRRDVLTLSDMEFKLHGIKSAVEIGQMEWGKNTHSSPKPSLPKPQSMPHFLKLAHSVGLPVEPDLKPIKEKPWSSTPFLRLSHEYNIMLDTYVGGGQLVISSGPPLRSEAWELQNKRSKAKSLLMERLSMKSGFQLKLEVARQLRASPRFYLPHNLDFRGRAYPIHSHLHHMSDDTARGLLTFAEPKLLGKTGMGWLMIHVANLFGHGEDKKMLSERVEFAERHMREILESAKSPLSEMPWWVQGEKPWELLAACLEIKRAKEYEAQGNRIETFPSSLPVHLDGSCNGLQHYAALGRDAACAAAVNLLPNPSERPRDVYSAVANAVEKKAQEDASPRVGEPVREAVKLLARNGGVDRKLVKQTVMTVAYGVTIFGAKAQIASRLKERGWPNDEIFDVSWYLAKRTFECIDEVFSNANATKDWLAKCARKVTSTGRTVSWTTPMRFPVVQPYVKMGSKQVKTSLQSATIKEEKPWSRESMQRVVDKRAQVSAFPPNYIHSLDSSHMMMTAIECRKQGVAFAGVHDSYWTHAGSVDQLATLLRHAFLDLHSKPLLQHLSSELQVRMDKGLSERKKSTEKSGGLPELPSKPLLKQLSSKPDLQGQMDKGLSKGMKTDGVLPHVLPELPKMGKLDVREVLRAEYFFS